MKFAAAFMAVVASTCLLVAPAWAAPDRPLVHAAVLRGRNPSFLLPVVSRDGGTLELEAHVSASEILDATNSTITVSVDGDPIRSVRLREVLAAAGVLRVAFRGLSRGRHLVRIEARLVTPDDSCLDEHYETSFIRLEASTTLTEVEAEPVVTVEVRPSGRHRHHRHGPRASRDEATMANADRVGLEPPTESLESFAATAFAEGSTLGLVLALDLDQAGVLSAVDFVTNAGLRGVDVELGRRDVTVVLRVPSSPNAHTGEGDSFDAALRRAGGPRVVVGVERRQLVVAGRSADDVRRGLATLADPTFLALCGARSVCEVPDGAPSAAVPRATSSERDALTLMTLADVGFPNGLVVRDVGRTLLRFVVHRSERMRIVRAPVLRLPISLPRHGGTRPFEVRVHVTVNEQPIDSLVLGADAPENGEIRVALPLSLVATSPTWIVDVALELRPTDPSECARFDGESAWARLDPDGGIDAEREEGTPVGIAAAFLASTTRRPRLVWGVGVHDAGEAVALARLLLPFARRAPDDVYGFGPASGPGDARAVVRLGAATTASGGLTRTVTRDGGRFLAVTVPDGAPPPLLDARHTAVIEAEPAIEGRAPTLHVQLPTDGSPLAAPDYARLETRLAVATDGQWHALGRLEPSRARRAIRRPEDAANAPAVHRSVHRARVQTVNMVWAGLLAAFAALGLLVEWRRRRTRGVSIARDDLESFGTRDGG